MIRPLGISPALTISSINATGGLVGTVTPVGKATEVGGTKPAGGWKFVANVALDSTGLKLSGSWGSDPGVD